MNHTRPKVGVGVIVWKDGTFLMGKRVGKHGNGKWSVPGGYLEYGESFEEGAVREALEETGVRVKNVRFEAVTNNLFPEEEKHTITIFMRSDWAGGQPKDMELDKFIDIGWFTFETMPDDLFVPVLELKKQSIEHFRDNP